MTFWLHVAVGYVLILGIGLTVGHYLSSKFPGRGHGGGSHRYDPTEPPAPTFGAEWPELGSEFDRTLLPGAFADAPLAWVG
jgi:hypothetical protein